VELKIELSKWKEGELGQLPKFREKEALINNTIERLIEKAAETISEECITKSENEIK
jgi:hypothetical protein